MNLIFRLFLFTFLLLQIAGCKKKEISLNKSEITSTSPKSDGGIFTVIFHQRDTIKETPGIAKAPSDVSHLYWMDNFELQHFMPKDNESNDTITIGVGLPTLQIDLTYYQIDLFSFLLQNKDTLHIQYQDGFPVAEVFNRTHPPLEYKYDSIRKNRFNKLHLENNEIYEYSPRESLIFIKNDRKNYSKQENEFIDSLYKESSISKDYYEFLLARIKFQQLIDLTSSYITKSIDSDSILINQRLLNKPKYLNYIFYYKFLFNYTYNIVNGASGFKNTNGFTYNSPRAFDKVIEDSLIHDKQVKNAIYTMVLRKIHENFSEEQFNNYLKKFENQVQDSSLVNSIRNSYLVNLDYYKEIKDTIFLLDNQKNRFKLDQLIRESNNEIVYVDFWASWCVPCRKAMPASHQLMKSFDDKVKFIYISIDRNFEDWKDAEEKENLTMKNSYYAINYPNGEFFQRLGIKSIPRYLIFKNGKLIYRNAPGPSSENIEEIFKNNISIA